MNQRNRWLWFVNRKESRQSLSGSGGRHSERVVVRFVVRLDLALCNDGAASVVLMELKDQRSGRRRDAAITLVSKSSD